MLLLIFKNKFFQKTLEREAKKAAWLIIWTDCDREGENIGYEVIEVCQAVKPNIKIFRAKFSEITKRSIERQGDHLYFVSRPVHQIDYFSKQLSMKH